MKHLPAGVWENPNLIVERFVPEREAGYYFLRFWTFLGDRSISGRVGSRDPIVRISRAETPITSVDIPPELHAWRKELGLDYGRLDYVLHDGKPILLDANKTLGCDKSLRTDNGMCDDLAEGIKDVCINTRSAHPVELRDQSPDRPNYNQSFVRGGWSGSLRCVRG